jgi:hypothetical protein
LKVISRSPIEYIQYDGASLHNADVKDVIESLVNENGTYVKAIRQPTYSPYVNPCEPANGTLKAFLRWDENPGMTKEALQEQLGRVVPLIKRKHLRAWWDYSLFDISGLPELEDGP